MRNETMTLEVKNGRDWETTYTTTDPEEIFRELSNDLIAKKLCKSSSIRSISRRNNYDGTNTVTVDYGNGTRRRYTIKR